MAKHDSDHTSPDGPSSAMAGNVLLQEMNSQGQLSPYQPTYVPSTRPQPPEILRRGIDQSGLLNALRRRWLMATGLGVLVAVAAGVALWFLFPEYNRATALLRVYSRKPAVLEDINLTAETKDFEIFQSTQLAMIKSFFVLTAALRDPELAEIPVLNTEEEPMEWLRDNIDARFEQRNSEILQVSLAEDLPEKQLEAIVNAVINAYMAEAVHTDRQLAQFTRDLLDASYDRVQEDLIAREDEYWQLADELGTQEAQTAPIQSQIALGQLRVIQRDKSQYQNILMNSQMMLQTIKAQQSDPVLMEQMVLAQVQQDPEIMMINQQIMYYRNLAISRSSALKGTRGNAATRSMRMQVAKLEQQLAQRQAQLVAQAMAQMQGQPNLQERMAKSSYEALYRTLGVRLQMLNRQEQEIVDEIMNLAKRSTELARKRSEIEQLTELSGTMGTKLKQIEIEINAPERVTVFQRATAQEGINSFQRYVIAGGGGLLALMLTCFCVGYIEFRNRRLDGPAQIDEGLGLRVIGTLPGLSHRRLGRESDPVVANLLDSIDSVRTTLMHDAATKDRRVVLITSATQLEGRTTVASQLAASLARAGRRTLLIDGDVRRPALHTLFDMPLENGLCEVLRAEVDVADAIRPTHAEGLWVMTAGYCDTDATQAMANDQLQPIFEQIRNDYDFVIVDGAPVIGLADSLMMGQYCDGAVLSVLRDYSQTPKIYHAAETLRGVGIRLIGAVVNGMRPSNDARVERLHLAPPRVEEEPLAEEVEA